MSWHYTDQWAAGFFDGEGSISITKRKRTEGFVEHHLSVQIVQKDKRPLLEIQKYYGGSLTSTNGNKGRTSVWRLRFHGTKAGAFLEAIFPYSLVKKEEIAIGLKLRSAIGRPGCRSNDRLRNIKEESYQELRRIRQERAK